MPNQWEFRQLGGEKKVLTLANYSAPFGRARKSALIEEVIKVTVQTTRYPGSKKAPTRHTFGSGWEPMSLNGRWSTRQLAGSKPGEGYTAGELADAWSLFVRDEQTVRVSWGNVFSFQCIIEELHLSRESEDEIAWKMQLLVDQRDDIPSNWRLKGEPANIIQDVAALQTFAADYQIKPTTVPDMAPSLFDQLEMLTGNIKSYTGALAEIADLGYNLEQATFSTIQNFRGIISNLESAIVTMRLTILNAQLDSVSTIKRAETDIAWYTYKASYDIDSINAFAILKEMDKKMELAQRSDLSKFITAQDNDDWEKLAYRAGLGIDRASDMRSVNGISFGQLPIPGQIYVVPQ